MEVRSAAVAAQLQRQVEAVAALELQLHQERAAAAEAAAAAQEAARAALGGLSVAEAGQLLTAATRAVPRVAQLEADVVRVPCGGRNRIAAA